ncbi:MAG: acetyltransferase [Lentisphaeria bacterium]|nr:acetyltransferase [Lentisphaeria bacterium]
MTSPETRTIVLYGNGKLAELLLAVMAGDSRFRVCGVTADAAFVRDSRFHGLPLVPFESVEEAFPPDRYGMLVTVGYRSMRLRREMFLKARARGYRMPNYIARTARVFPDLALGENNILFDMVYVGPRCRLGDNTVLRPQLYIGHESVVEDHAFITSGATVGSRCRIGALTFFGLGVTVLPGTGIAPENLIAAGSLVARGTEPGGVYMGHPARRVREVGDAGVTVLD